MYVISRFKKCHRRKGKNYSISLQSVIRRTIFKLNFWKYSYLHGDTRQIFVSNLLEARKRFSCLVKVEFSQMLWISNLSTWIRIMNQKGINNIALSASTILTGIICFRNASHPFRQRELKHFWVELSDNSLRKIDLLIAFVRRHNQLFALVSTKKQASSVISP